MDYIRGVMGRVERRLFIPPQNQHEAHLDTALAIGHGQTISQPTVVAHMTEALKPGPNDRVLEIGTGCGYQTAILAEIVKEVYTIEILEPLANQSRDLLTKLNYNNIQFRNRDGYSGWPEAAPFDKIIVTAAPPKIPQSLLDQLKPGGRMTIPVGRVSQKLLLIEKTPEGFTEEIIFPVRFVSMTGTAQDEQP
jgi:protein-L-isoaspartate(D-aspartate) O-methyltransferase